MLTITQHKLTPLQIALIQRSLEFLATDGGELTSAEVNAMEDAIEALNENIFGGRQEILIRYVSGPPDPLHCLRCGRLSGEARFCSLECAHLGST